MAQSGWRLPDDLLKRVRVHCAMSGERQNAFVERALESALSSVPAVLYGTPKSDGTDLSVKLPRPPAKKAAKASSELPKIAPRRWAK